MIHEIPIPDLYVRPIEPVEHDDRTVWIALEDGDHLLRRFGSAEIVRLSAVQKPGLRMRRVADEVWTLVEGTVEFHWYDLRQGSPSQGIRHRMITWKPHRVLVPFGVAFGVRALNRPAQLLRLATHADGDPASEGDRDLPWEPAA